MAAQSAGSLESRFSSSGVRLERALSPTPVWGDPARLGQVVTNLLVNAAKFTPAGGTVTLFVGTYRHGARLEVTDSGQGILPEELDRVFERFFRGSAGRKVGGSGIGLAVVKDLEPARWRGSFCRVSPFLNRAPGTLRAATPNHPNCTKTG